MPRVINYVINYVILLNVVHNVGHTALNVLMLARTVTMTPADLHGTHLSYGKGQHIFANLHIIEQLTMQKVETSTSGTSATQLGNAVDRCDVYIGTSENGGKRREP